SNDAGDNWLTGKWGGLNGHYANGWVSMTTNTDGLQTATNNVPVIGAALGDVTANSSAYFRNGLNVTDPGGTAPNGSPGHLSLGGYGAFNEPSQVDISSVIVFNRVLNTAERSIVENYLSATFGIAIANPALPNPPPASYNDDHYAGKLAANGSYS